MAALAALLLAAHCGGNRKNIDSWSISAGYGSLLTISTTVGLMTFTSSTGSNQDLTRALTLGSRTWSMFHLTVAASIFSPLAKVALPISSTRQVRSLVCFQLLASDGLSLRSLSRVTSDV